jgi:hypothetical protein
VTAGSGNPRLCPSRRHLLPELPNLRISLSKIIVARFAVSYAGQLGIFELLGFPVFANDIHADATGPRKASPEPTPSRLLHRGSCKTKPKHQSHAPRRIYPRIRGSRTPTSTCTRAPLRQPICAPSVASRCDALPHQCQSAPESRTESYSGNDSVTAPPSSPPSRRTAFFRQSFYELLLGSAVFRGRTRMRRDAAIAAQRYRRGERDQLALLPR